MGNCSEAKLAGLQKIHLSAAKLILKQKRVMILNHHHYSILLEIHKLSLQEEAPLSDT